MQDLSIISVVASALSEDVREAPRLARVAGFGGIVVDAVSSSLDITSLSASGRRELRNLLSAQRQTLVALRSDLDARGLSPKADVDRALARLDRALESAAELGAGCLAVDLGPLPEPPRRVKPKPAVTPEQAGLIILAPSAAAPPPPAEPEPARADAAFLSHLNAALVELGQRADRYGVPVALSSTLASFAALESALAAAACPWFGVDLDPVAILRDEWDMDAVFSTLGPLVRHVRARDAVVGADRRTKPAAIGHGSVNWPHLLSNLESSGYPDGLTIDPTDLPDRRSAALAGKQFLTTLR